MLAKLQKLRLHAWQVAIAINILVQQKCQIKVTFYLHDTIVNYLVFLYIGFYALIVYVCIIRS